MDYLKNNPYSILVIPLVWGVYEVRKLRYQLFEILTLAKEYQIIAVNLNKKINDLASNKTDTIPVLNDIQMLTKKINRIFNVPEETEKSD